jgi:hypothetical protein
LFISASQLAVAHDPAHGKEVCIRVEREGRSACDFRPAIAESLRSSQSASRVPENGRIFGAKIDAGKTKGILAVQQRASLLSFEGSLLPRARLRTRFSEPVGVFRLVTGGNNECWLS